MLFEYNDDTYNDAERLEIKGKIERHLRNSSAFTAFKRWIVRDNEFLMEDFKIFLHDSPNQT